MQKFKIGQTTYYMYLNMICKCKVETVETRDGLVYYNGKILETYLFKTKEQLFDFHSGRIRKKQLQK